VAGTFGALYKSYYVDGDGDTYGRVAVGWYCSASSDVATGTNGHPWVDNQTDIDDNCKCSTNNDTYDSGTNPIPCHDDCGLCSYDSDGVAMTARNDYRLCADGSTDNVCNDGDQVGTDEVWSDCTGACYGVRRYYELFENGDSDDFGGTSKGYHFITRHTMISFRSTSKIIAITILK
jgi:hypothetical protein